MVTVFALVGNIEISIICAGDTDSRSCSPVISCRSGSRSTFPFCLKLPGSLQLRTLGKEGHMKKRGTCSPPELETTSPARQFTLLTTPTPITIAGATGPADGPVKRTYYPFLHASRDPRSHANPAGTNTRISREIRSC